MIQGGGGGPKKFASVQNTEDFKASNEHFITVFIKIQKQTLTNNIKQVDEKWGNGPQRTFIMLMKQNSFTELNISF